MKLKFIFNETRDLARSAFRASLDVVPRNQRIVCGFLVLTLIVAIAVTLPARAQQPSPSASPQAQSAPPVDSPVASDPPADDSTESMFPHFKDSRFWLSGQANFVFQAHPDF